MHVIMPPPRPRPLQYTEAITELGYKLETLVSVS